MRGYLMNLSKGFALQRGYRSLSELLKMRSEEANLNNKKKRGGKKREDQICRRVIRNDTACILRH